MSEPHFSSVLPRSAAPTTRRPLPHNFTSTRRAETGGSIRILLAGELDLAARPHFESALVDAQGDSDRVLLDLGALTMIDCAGLFVLFAAAERSREEHGMLILLSPSGQVRQMIGAVGVPAGVAILDREDLPARRIGLPALKGPCPDYDGRFQLTEDLPDE
jgi:anti-anti-sigma factor